MPPSVLRSIEVVGHKAALHPFFRLIFVELLIGGSGKETLKHRRCTRMAEDLYSRWSREIERSVFFHPGERVAVAVSGGPDSVLLFDFMKQLAGDIGLLLAVVHFNHRLRGAESDADEAFVRDLARGIPAGPGDIEYIRAEADVGRVARGKHHNIEATARELRYGFFFSLLHQGRVDKVVTAHTANDQAETVLLKLLRGAGTRGLGGIYPVLPCPSFSAGSDDFSCPSLTTTLAAATGGAAKGKVAGKGKVVRPFLSLTRAEVEGEIARRGLSFRTDSTNRNPHLARNKVRLELLPALARDFNPAVVKLLKEFADRARDDEAYLEQQAAEQARAWRVREGAEERIPLRALIEFPPAIERRVLRQMIGAARGSLQGVTREHVEALRRLARESQSGRRLVLPGRVIARRNFDWLVISPGLGVGQRAAALNRKSATTDDEHKAASCRTLKPATAAAGCFEYPVTAPCTVEVRELGLTLRFKIVGAAEERAAYNDNGAVYLHGRKLSGKLILRNWRAGDRFRPCGSRRAWKLKELFRQKKIDTAERAHWPVLECDGEIVWVRGFSPAGAAFAQATGAVMMIEEESSVVVRPSSG